VREIDKVDGRCLTLDVNPTSGSRVKARLYETRAVEAGGNILLLQGQLSVRQFRTLEAILMAGADGDGTEVLRIGRYYALTGQGEDGVGAGATSATGGAMAKVRNGGAAVGLRRRVMPLRKGGEVAGRVREELRPRAPWITGPVIGPDGADDDGDDYEVLALHHVERLLRRRRAG
jgi:hypothetical protein